MADDLTEIRAFMRINGPRCGVAIAAAKLTASDRKKFLQALPLTDEIHASALSAWARSKGVPISGASIQRHRRESCSCLT